VKREIDIDEISKFHLKYREKKSLSLGREGKACLCACPFWALTARVARTTARSEGKIVLSLWGKGQGEGKRKEVKARRSLCCYICFL